MMKATRNTEFLISHTILQIALLDDKGKNKNVVGKSAFYKFTNTLHE